ncbi:MAG: hypothetical protein RLZZ450_1002 [Pseudomonadota bacterium]|jgi:hypothetical protein
MPKSHSLSPSAGTLSMLSSRSREILELYASALPEVAFPDLDLASLHACADQLREAQDVVDRLESELHDARELVASQSAALDARAERALAYARIYAEGKPELQAAVSAIRPYGAHDGEAGATKRRGRPRKHEAHEGQLDVLESAAE